MTTVLFVTEELAYHRSLADGTVLSLRFANPDREPVLQCKEQLREEAEGEAEEFRSEIRTVTFDESIHALYAAEVNPREFPTEDIESLSPRESDIVDTLFQAFSSFEEEWAAKGDPLKWYKQPNVQRIVQEVNETQWQQPVPDVAGCLLSNLIFAHPLPNANHRSSLSFVETYLSTFEPEFEIPDTGVHGEWYDWAKEFVRESKRLLSLSRKARMFCHLQNWGCDAVVRKNNVTIEFDEYDIEVPHPRPHFREQHQELSTQFVYQVLERTEYDTLIGVQDPGKQVFLDRLSSGQ